MLKTLAVANYRSINKLVIPLGRLNPVSYTHLTLPTIYSV